MADITNETPNQEQPVDETLGTGFEEEIASIINEQTPTFTEAPKTAEQTLADQALVKLENALATEELYLDLLNGLNEEKKAYISSRSDENIKARGAIEQADADIAHSNQKITGLEARLTKFTEFDKAKNGLEEQISGLKDQETRLQDLKNQEEEKLEQIEAFIAKYNDADNAQEDTASILEEINKIYPDLDIKSLQELQDRTDGKIKAINAELSSIAPTADRLNTEIRRANANIGAITSNYSQTETVYTREDANKIQELEEDVQAHEKDVNFLKEKQEKLQTRIKELSDAKTTGSKAGVLAKHEAEDKIAEYKEELETLSPQIEQASELVESKKQEIADIKDGYKGDENFA